MRDDGSDLKKLQDRLDVSVMEIAHAADLHPQTVYKVLANIRTARNSVNRVKKALRQLQEGSGTKPKSKVAG